MVAHWYFLTHYYCPICGSEENLRTRMYGARPPYWEDRHEVIEGWDYCGI